ncbi:hypothetical protein B0H14DRAFT_3506969 [Mycena olivaceomarginata]|nr:hypothetical protein B0H14DRAFT_3506969 [Mycena olivaceomarginata]
MRRDSRPKLPPIHIPWDDKKSRLYKLGSSNGGHIVGENYRSFPRFRLVELGREHPELMNVKMARLEGHCGKDCDRDRVIAEYNITGLIFSFQKETLEYKYKYVLDIDGNTFSGRFLNLLKPGSLVFKSTVFEGRLDSTV